MIDKLEMFIALARERHFGRAAVACGVTQPTLSAAIKQLEDQLGVQLVLRGSRYGGLTPEGARVLDWARRIVGDARSMREEMRAVKHGLSGNLRLAAIPTALPVATALTGALAQRHPGLRYTILSRSSAEILDMLGNFQIDAGLTYLDNEPLGRVSQVALYAEHYYVVAPVAMTPDRASMGWDQVAALPLCLLTDDMQNRRIVAAHMAQAGAQAQPQLEANSIISLISHVKTGKWATVLPLKLAELFLSDPDICAIPIDAHGPAHNVGLIAPMRAPHTPVLQALLGAAERLAAATA